MSDEPAHPAPRPAVPARPVMGPTWAPGPLTDTDTDTAVSVPGPPRLSALAAPAAVLAAGAAAFGWAGAVDPGVPGRYPVCPLFHLTGLLCPGCGGLRSVHALAQGEPAAAFGANALVVPAVAAAAVLWVLWTVRALRAATGSVRAAGSVRAVRLVPTRGSAPTGRSAPGADPADPLARAARAAQAAQAAQAASGRAARTGWSRLPWWAAGALVAAFTIVRNLSFGAGLAP